MNDLNDAAFEPGLTSNRASSLRGRRSKGKGKGVRPRAFSLARSRAPKIPPSPSPFNACHTRYWGSPERRDEFGKSQRLTKPRLVWSVCRSLGKTVHTFGKFLATPLI